MSPAPSAEGGKAALAAAIDPYRTRLANDAMSFTTALLALAKHNAQQGGSFNETSPEDLAALKALARWRADGQHALLRVRGASSSDPHDRKLAVRWLKALIAAVDLQRQALSLVDPESAAAAARSAGKRMDEYFHLESRLEEALT